MEVLGGIFFVVVAFCGIAWGLVKNSKPKIINIAIKTHEEHDDEGDRKYFRAVAKMRESYERDERSIRVQAMKDKVVLRSTQFRDEGK
jgi:hypothetical protein